MRNEDRRGVSTRDPWHAYKAFGWVIQGCTVEKIRLDVDGITRDTLLVTDEHGYLVGYFQSLNELAAVVDLATVTIKE